MTKVSYASLKLKNKDSVKNIKIGDKDIEIKQYLPIEEKENLIDSVLQKSLDRGVFNPLSIEIYFYLNVIYLYTNISFTEAQRKDEEKIYDIFESNGYIDLIIENIPEEEYNHLWTVLTDTIEAWSKYNTSASSIFKDFIELLPVNAQRAADIINNINTSEIGNVIDFAKAINNDKDV